jgi:hypothetical protein
MQKVMYLLVSQHVSSIIMPIIRRIVQNRQRLWYTALAVLRTTTTTRAAPTQHRAEYLCYWFSSLTLLMMGENARNM